MHEADDSNYHSLTIGFIPIKNNNEIIAVGDASGSGTKEVFFEIYGDHAQGEKSFKLKIGRSNIFNASSKFWHDIAASAEDQLTKGKFRLNPKDLAYCFLFPQGEAFSNDDIWHVATPDECGEFHNEEREHSGKYYVRYQFVADDDYLDENVFVIQNDQ